MKFLRNQKLNKTVFILLLLVSNALTSHINDKPSLFKPVLVGINPEQKLNAEEVKRQAINEEEKAEIERLRSIKEEEYPKEELSDDSPPTITEQLKQQEMDKLRFAQTGNKAAPPLGLMRDANPFMLNTEHVLKKPPANPADFEVEVVPRSANSQTHYSWGFWPFRAVYSAINALKGRFHSKWQSKQHAIDDHWEAVFAFPQKLDAFEITWLLPPERFRIYFKLEDGSKYIPLTELIEKYTKLENGKNKNRDTVSLTDAFIFHKPIFAKRIRIAMNKPVKQDTFSIEFVRFYEKRTVVMIRNHSIYPNKQMCFWCNNPDPKEFDRIELIDCTEAVQLGDNRELWVYYTDKTIRHYISHMCMGFDDRMNLVMRKCIENDPNYKVLVNTDGSLTFEGFEEKVISANTQNRVGQNFVNPQTELTVSSQADGGVYRKENITIGGNGHWMSRPGEPSATVQVFFGKQLKGYQNYKVDVIRIDWVLQPKDFIVYSWKQGSTWVMLQKFQNLRSGVGTSTIQLLGEEFSALMIHMTKPNLDKNGTYAYAIGSIFIGCNALTVSFNNKANASSRGIVYDFDIQYNTVVAKTKGYNQARTRFALASEGLIGSFRLMMNKMPSLMAIKERALAHKARLDVGNQYLKENAQDKLDDFVNNALNTPTNPMFMNQVLKFAPHAEYSGLINKPEGSNRLGTKSSPANDCLHIKKIDRNSTAGFYYIQPECAYQPIRVFCDFNLYEAAVDIFVENDNNPEPDPDLRNLNVKNALDIREICAKRGLEPIQIRNGEMLSRIGLVLKSLGYFLREGKVIPIAYDYSCDKEACVGNYNSFNDVNSIPVNTFSSILKIRAASQPNMVGFTENSLSAMEGSNSAPPLFKFSSTGAFISGAICSTNHNSDNPRDDNVLQISCEHNVSSNNELFPTGRTVLINCPSGCNMSPGVIYGNIIYHSVSMICKSAIHNNKIRVEGGKVYIHISHPIKKYNSISYNDIPSQERIGTDQDKSFSFSKYKPQCKYDLIQQLRKNAPKTQNIPNKNISFFQAVKNKSKSFVDKMKSLFSFMELNNMITSTPVNNSNIPNNNLNAQKLIQNQQNLNDVTGNPANNINLNNNNSELNRFSLNQSNINTNTINNGNNLNNNTTNDQMNQNILPQKNNNNSYNLDIKANPNNNSNIDNPVAIISPNTKLSNGYYPQSNSDSLERILKKHKQPTQEEINEDLKNGIDSNIFKKTPHGTFLVDDILKPINPVNNNAPHENEVMKVDKVEHITYKDSSNSDIQNLMNIDLSGINPKHLEPAKNEIDPSKIPHEHVSYTNYIPEGLQVKQIPQQNRQKIRQNNYKEKLQMKKLLEEGGQTMKEEALELIDEKDLKEMGFSKETIENLKKKRFREMNENKPRVDIDENGKLITYNNQSKIGTDINNNTEFDKLRFAQANAKAGVNPGLVAQAAAASGIEKAIKHKIENGVMNLFGMWDPLHGGYGHSGVGLNGELNGDAHLAAQVMGLGDAVTSGALGGNAHTTEAGANLNVGIGTNGLLTMGGPGYAGQLMGERGQLMEGANFGVAKGSRGSSSGKVGDPSNSSAYRLAGDALLAAQAAARGLNIAGAGGGAWNGANPTLGAGYGLGGRLGVGSGNYPGMAHGFGSGISGAIGAGRGAVGLYDTPGHYVYGGIHGRGGGGGGGGGAYGMGAAYGYGKGGMTAFINYSTPGAARMGYNQGAGIGAAATGTGHGGFYGGYEGGFNNDTPGYNGKAGAFGEHGKGFGLGGGISGGIGAGVEGDFDSEWGEHLEDTGDWDVAWDSGEANAKPLPEPFIPKDVIEDEPPKTSIPQVPSTERIMKEIDLIYEEHDRKGLLYWEKMRGYIQGQGEKIKNDIDWASPGSPYGIEGLTNYANQLKADSQKFKAYIETIKNKSRAKHKRTSNIINGFKEKIKEMTKTDTFNMNFGGGDEYHEETEDGGTEIETGTEGHTEGGGGSTTTTTTTTETKTTTTKTIEKCIKELGNKTDGGSGGSGGDIHENFKHYFNNRFDEIGEANFDITTDNIKGRKSSVCSGGKTIADCNSVTNLISSSPNIPSDNIIVIKNKSYYDFDLNVDVLFRQVTKAGITFRMRDQYNYYAFIIDVPTRSKQLVKVTDGRYQVLKKVEDGGIILNDWHRIHISLTNSNMKVFIYDAETVDRKSSEKIIEFYDNSFIEGSIGILTSNSEGFCFDKLSITGKIVWTPWIPRNDITIIQNTSGSFNENFKNSVEEGYDVVDAKGSDVPSEWNNKSEDGYGEDTGLFQKSDICDSSELKLPSFVLKKKKPLKHGTLSVSFVPPQSCSEGIVSVIIKYNKKTSKGGQESIQYYSFEMINSPSTGNMYRLRKFSDGFMNDIKIINNPKDLPNLPFDIGFTPEVEHKVVITSNGKKLKILLSVNNSPFSKILTFNSVDIKQGLIGVGTCKCKARFKEIRLRPPKLTLSEEDKKEIMNGTGTSIVSPKGSWENQSNEMESQDYKEESEEASSNSIAEESESFNNKNRAVEQAKSEFEASSDQTSSSSEYSSIETDNKLENGSSVNESNIQIREKRDGNIEIRGWNEEGYSYSSTSTKTFRKDFIAGWEVCITTRTSNDRNDFCEKINLTPQRNNCKNNFCSTCCDDRISEDNHQGRHQCVKYCNLSTAAKENVDVINTCVKPNFDPNSYTYCKNTKVDSGNINQCNLEMCNFCCSVLDPMFSTEISNRTLNLCLEECSNGKFIVS